MLRFSILPLLLLFRAAECINAPSATYMEVILGRPVYPPSNKLISNLPSLLFPENLSEKLNQIHSFAAADEQSCLEDLKTIASSVYPGKQQWALKYIDAWAKPPAGIMQGNYLWFGDFDECLAIETVFLTQNRTIIPQFCHVVLSPFPANNFTPPDEGLMQYSQGFSLGLCLTKACNSQSVKAIITGLLPSSSGFHVVSSGCQIENPPPNKFSFIAIGIFSAVGVFILLGLVVDLVFRLRAWFHSWTKGLTSASLNDLLFVDNATITSGYSNLLDNANVRQRHRNAVGASTEDDPIGAALCDNDSASLVLPIANGQANGIERPFLHGDLVNNIQASSMHSINSKTGSIFTKQLCRFLICFSPYTNISKLFTLPPSAETIPNLNAFHAVRAISTFWVILGHCYVFLIGSLDNLWTIGAWPKRFSFQFILAGLFAVDSFFFLSGFFAYWSISKNLDLLHTSKSTRKSRFWFWKSLPFVYLHRFLRLTGPYMAVILIDLGLWRHLGNGPFYFQGIDEQCRKYWWTNLLYINNMLKAAEGCAGWGWYLAVDMQLFLLVPFLVVLFSWRPRWAWFACIIALLGQCAAATAITYIYKLPSAFFQDFAPGGNITAEIAGDPNASPSEIFFDLLYVKPWARLGPYVVGVMYGHIVVKHSLYLTRNIFSHPMLATCGWFICVVTMMSVIYGQFGIYAGYYVNPRPVDALYNSVARIAWGIGLGWLVLAAVVNRAGPLGRILSWPGWALPAKLTYSAYLVHPLILLYFIQTMTRPFHATDLTMILFYCGILSLTFITATLFSLLFESPIISLQRWSSKAGFSF